MSIFVRKTRLISMVILVIMFVNMFSGYIVFAETKSDNQIYDIDDNGVLVKYMGDNENIILPESVKVIKKGAFKDKGIETIILNEGLEIIEMEAFSNNKIRGELKIPSSVKVIGERAFADNLISKIDFNNINKDLLLKDAVFQDNKIKGILDLSSYKGNIPKRAFWNNEITELMLSSDINILEDEAFAINKLNKVYVHKNMSLGKDVFASNGRFVEVFDETNKAKSDKSKNYNYGHIVNPVDIIVRSLEPIIENGKETGRYKRLISDRVVKFDPLNPDNVFSLNNTSFFKPQDISQYEVSNENMQKGLIEFTPNKENYILDIYYKRTPEPIIHIIKEAVQDLIDVKKAGDSITQEELLSLIYALDYKDTDITNNVKVNPKELINVESKEYTIVYTVLDKNGLYSEKEITIPIAIDPLKIPIGNSEWVLGDFTYSGNSVTGLSSQGKEKAAITGGIAIPHMNPETMEPITNVEFVGLSGIITPGPLIVVEPNNIIKFGYSAFENTPITGELPPMKNLKKIESSAFKGSQITGGLKGMDNLKTIEYSAFENSNLDGEILDLPMLEKIGATVFKGTNITKLPENMMKLKEVGNSAFQDITSLVGDFPITPELEIISFGAFQNTGISGKIKDFSKLKIMGDSAFEGTQITALPEVPLLEEIRSSALKDTKLEEQLPDMPNLKYVGQMPFGGVVGLNGTTLPKMPNIEVIEYGGFSSLGLVGEFADEYPNLKTLGVMAFYGNDIKGDVPKMPVIEEIQDWAFNGLDIEGELGDMPELRVIGTSAFYGTQISGEFPKAPKIERLGDTIFTGANLSIKEPIIFENNQVSIEERAFEELSNTEYPIILLTADGEAAPNVKESKYHLLNPTNVNVEAVDDEGSHLYTERIIATKDGEYVVIDLPRLMGYKSPTQIRIKESEIVNGSYTHIYEKIKEPLFDYNFKYTSKQNNGYYAGDEVINTNISMDTINNEPLEDGIIDVYYNEFIYEDFYVPIVKSVDKVEYNDGFVRIYLEKNIKPGVELEIPVSFKIKDGTIPETLFPVKAELNDLADGDDRLKGFGELQFGAIYVDPIYISEYYTKEDTFRATKTVEDLNKDYDVSVELFPSTDKFIRKFDKVIFEYDAAEFNVKDGTTSIATIEGDNGWKFKDNKYIYEMDKDIPGDLAEANIPPLKLNFKNPATTLKFIEIDSRVKANINTKIEDFKYTEMENKNYLFIHVAEEGPYSIGKAISVPHYEHPQYSFFYDNVRERQTEFIWRLYYSTGNDMDKVILTDYDLDERMKYTSINPKELEPLVNFYDINNEIIKTQIISEFYEIPENIQEDITKIEMIYDAGMKPIDASPEIGTKLRDPEIRHYNEDNEEANDFWNEYKVDVTFADGFKSESIDRAKTTIKPDNKYLATEVKVNTKTENLTYGKIANTDFYIKSKEFIDLDIREMKYTAFINKGQKVEDVIIADGLKGNYSIKENYEDGLTKIDFVFKDFNAALKNYKDRQKLFSVKTTPIDKKVLTLNPQGLLHPSEDHYIYQEGEVIIGDYDSSKYSYSEDTKNIINGAYFTVLKKIGDGKNFGNELKSEPGDPFFYRFEIDNATNTDKIDFEIIDILPFEGDKNKSEYTNKIDLNKISNIKLPEGFSIQYYNTDKNIDVDNTDVMKELRGVNWASNPASNTKAIRIVSESIEPQSEPLAIDIPMITNPNLELYDNGKKNVNIFAYYHNELEYNQALSNAVEQVIDIDVPEVEIKLRKASAFKGKIDGYIRDVEFILTTTEGVFVDSAKTDKDGRLSFKDIPAGDYVVEELKAPIGYIGKIDPIRISSKDMLNAKDNILDLGDIINNRIDRYKVLFKDVEYLNNIDQLNYKELKNSYSKPIKSGEFIITDNETGIEVEEFRIEDRNGLSIVLPVGEYTIREKNPPVDNGVKYNSNANEYQFEINKFGKILIGDKDLENKEEQDKNIIYFPHEIDPSFSDIKVNKVDIDGNPVEGAIFRLTNTATKEYQDLTSDHSGELMFKTIESGLYTLEEIKAPEGYIKSNRVEFIDVPVYEDKVFEFEFINKQLKLNIHKYKIIQTNLNEEEANRVASEMVSYTGGNFITKEIASGLYEVREVWGNNEIEIETNKESLIMSTNENGSVLNAQDSLKYAIDTDDVFTVKNKTDIPGHYQEIEVDASISDYLKDPAFDGTIDIDIIVKPLKGIIFVSRYTIDENGEEMVKGDIINGSRYALYSNKGNGFEFEEEKEIVNGDFLVFNDLNPLYEYKVVEMSVPEGQDRSLEREYVVNLNEANRFTKTVIFRNRIMENSGSFKIKKIDGRTEEVIPGVEFLITNNKDESFVVSTDEFGEVLVEDLSLEDANYTVKELRAAKGYRLSQATYTITKDDLINEKELIVKNYKYNETPKTGTSGKLPFFIIAIALMSLAFILKKKD